VTVIEARGLRRDFMVRVKSGWLRREARVVAAVDGIDVSVERGETLGYIGPNGAGKSTTLKMLTGVLYPSGGRVRVCGLEPVPQRTRLARRIGVVFGQRSQLWWDLPLRDSFALLRHVYGGRPRITPPAWLAAGGSWTWTRLSTCRCGSSRSGNACAAN
jgi:viologen exporter family transport system ATP-binding protein